MQPDNPKTGWDLWLQWVLASILGYGIGTTIGNALANLIPAMTCTQSFSDSFFDRLTNFPCIQPSLDLILIGVVLGLVSGFMQWLVLRRWIAGTGWWMPATGLGLPIALVCPIPVRPSGWLVDACPPSWLTRGWRPGCHCILCYGPTSTLSIPLDRGWSHVWIRFGCHDRHSTGLAATPPFSAR